MIEREAVDEAATRELGGRLARACVPGTTVYLVGPLGAGKTTLVRGLLWTVGVSGPVRSPTFTLLETYAVGGRLYAHLDLYRIADPEELDFLGLRDLLAQQAVLLVEWPERGEGALPEPDLRLTIDYAREGRRVTVEAESELGERALAMLLAASEA